MPRALSRGALLAALLAYFFALRLYSGFDLGTEWVDGDVGVRAAQAERVLQGQLPYRDFWAHYPPLPYYTNALLFRLFGVQLSSFRIGLALVGASTCFLAYVIVRRLASWTAAVGALALCMSWSVVDLNVNYNTWYCVPLCLAALWATLVAVEGQRPWPWFLAGVFGGLALGFKLNYGLFVLTAIGVTVLSRAGRPSAGWFRYVRPALLAFAGLGGLVMIRESLSLATLVNFGLPMLACALWAATTTSEQTDGAGALRRLGLAGAGATAPLVPFAAYFAVTWNPVAFVDAAFLQFVRYGEAVSLLPTRPDARTALVGAFVLVCLIGATRRGQGKHPVHIAMLAIGVAGVFTTLAMPRPFQSSTGLWLYTLVKSWIHTRGFVPVVAVWCGLVLLWRATDRDKHAAVFTIAMFAAAALLTLFPYSDVNHQQWVWPPVVVLACVLLDRFVRNTGVYGRLVWTVPFGLAAVQAFALSTHFHRPDTAGGPWRWRPMLLAAPPRGDVYAAEERAVAIRDAVEFIATTTASDAPVFELYGHCLGFLAGRPNPTRYDYFWPGWLTDEDQRGVIAELEARPPPLIVGHKRNPPDEPLERFAGYFPVLGAYLGERYRPARLIGPYQFYVRRPASA